ncbi:MAG: acetyl-CoA carboxylase biotin carboxyl carrier protein subunit [Microbacterium sp.]
MELTQDEIERIMRILSDADFEYFEVRVGDSSMVVSRRPIAGQPRAASADPVPAAVAATPEAAVTGPAPSPVSPARSAAADAEGPAGDVVAAPMVGVFYSAPEPGAEPFVIPGAVVRQGQTIGLIEVMKMFNAVQAPADGVIRECLVASEEFVEYGQALFRMQVSS